MDPDELCLALVALLEELPPEARAALLLRAGFGASDAELARSLGLSDEACRELVHTARALLRSRGPTRRSR